MRNVRNMDGRAGICCGGASALVAAAGLACAAAAAGPIEVIYTKKAGDPKAVVPGAVDLSGAPQVVEWKAMEGFVLSPDGTQWILRARTNTTDDHDTGIVLGSGMTGAMLTVDTAGGPFVIQEGRPAPFGSAADWFDFMPTGFGRFDDSNNLVFGIRARPNQAVGGTSTDANRVIKWDGTTATLAFKQGDLYVDMIDLAPNPSGDETVGNSVGSYHLLNDGRVGSQDSTILNVHSSRRPAITYDLEMFHQTGVTTVPMGAFGAGQLIWATLDANEFSTTPDGQHWVVTGRVGGTGTTTADDGVLAYDGTVVLREGSDIPGTEITVGDFFQTFLAGNGDWVSRGRDNSATTAAAPDWAVKNGTLLAATGDEIAAGENWGDTFFAVTANRVGDWVLAGNTTNTDPAQDNVIVMNGEVVLREGDPVDLNGNGQFDDDAFIGRGVNTNAAFNPNTWFLTDDRVLYGIVMLRNSNGQDLTSTPVFGTPQAFIRIDVGTDCYPDCNGDTNLTISDFACFQTAFVNNEPYADCNQSGNLTIADFACFQSAFVAGCP